jgi:hypothetical protein
VIEIFRYGYSRRRCLDAEARRAAEAAKKRASWERMKADVARRVGAS